MAIPAHLKDADQHIETLWSPAVGQWVIFDFQQVGTVKNSDEWKAKYRSDRETSRVVLGVVVETNVPELAVGAAVMFFCSCFDLESWLDVRRPLAGDRYFVKRVADRKSSNGMNMHSYNVVLDDEPGKVLPGMVERAALPEFAAASSVLNPPDAAYDDLVPPERLSNANRAQVIPGAVVESPQPPIHTDAPDPVIDEVTGEVLHGGPTPPPPALWQIARWLTNAVNKDNLPPAYLLLRSALAKMSGLPNDGALWDALEAHPVIAPQLRQHYAAWVKPDALYWTTGEVEDFLFHCGRVSPAEAAVANGVSHGRDF